MTLLLTVVMAAPTLEGGQRRSSSRKSCQSGRLATLRTTALRLKSGIRSAAKRAVPRYGKWCGPGHSGPGKPKDQLDAACKRHDLRYDQGRSRSDRYEADKKFVKDLDAVNSKKLGTYGRVYRGGAKKVFKTKTRLHEWAGRLKRRR